MLGLQVPGGVDEGLPTLPPGTLGVPPVGEIVPFRLDPIGFLRRRQDQYGAVFKTYLGAPTVFMIGPDANRFILRESRELFSVGAAWPPYLRFMLGDDALSMKDGEEYLRLRRFVAPAFASLPLRKAFERMQEESEQRIDRWSASGPVRFLPLARSLILAMMSQWVLGPSKDVREARWLAGCIDAFTQVPDGRREATDGRQSRVRTPAGEQHKKRIARQLLEDYTRTVIARRRLRPGDDAVSLMCRRQDGEGLGLADSEITAQALMLLSAGTDSTSATLTWLVYALDRHPWVRHKLAAEIAEVVGERRLEWSHLRQLPYLHAVLKEVERMHPVALAPARVALDDFEFAGQLVPRDWMVRYCIRCTHFMPEVFADPATFDPDRFMPPREQDRRTPYSLIGFGSGPRHCLGKPLAQIFLQTFVVTLLQRADWVVLPGQDVTPVLDNNTTFKPRSRLWVQFAPRTIRGSGSGWSDGWNDTGRTAET